jgi:cytochrome d ubiquinol oxidase subunit II
MMDFDLPLIWAGIIGIAVALYVLLDGFDLGIGLLFPLFKGEGEREKMLVSIKPYWDGNETWLVMGGAGLLVAFPRAYAAIMPAVYLPIIVMLLGLVFRGVAIEFHGIARSSKPLWNTAMFVGSAMAALGQGLVLGTIVNGIPLHDGQFAGGPIDWATPFHLLCALAVAAGYALLGACWLIMKTEGDIAARARRYGRVLLVAVMGFMAAVSLWTPLANARIAERWFSLPNILYLWPIPAVAGVLALLTWHWLKTRDVLPFIGTMGLFMLGYLGLVISWFPYLVPPTLTIWDTAAAPQSQMFMLAGTLILLPVTLGYTAVIYWLFRGKIRAGETY